MIDYPASNPANSAPTPTTDASAPLVAIYWLIVLIPLCWGVYQTVQKSIPLFHVKSTIAAAKPGALPTSTPTISPPTVAADAPLPGPAAGGAASPTDRSAPMTLPASTPL